MENQNLLTTKNLLALQPQGLQNIERQLSISEVMRSGEPSVIALVKHDYSMLLRYAAMVVKNYLDYCFPNQSNIATQFAADLIEQRPDWKAADFLLCFKFIRTRQDIPELKVFGNTITPQRLNEMICVYEEQRSIERERLHAERKGLGMSESRQLNELAAEVAKKLNEKNPLVETDPVLGKQYEQTGAEMEKKRASPFYKEPERQIPDEKFFEDQKKTA